MASLSNMLMNFEEYAKDIVLVDGGSFLWRTVVMESESAVFRQLKLIRKFFGKTVVVVLDDDDAVRQREDMLYKANRPCDENRRLVLERRNMLWEDKWVYTIRCRGMEADDVIAYFVLLSSEVDVLSGDKDLFQIPKIRLWSFNRKDKKRGFIVRKSMSDIFPAYVGQFAEPGYRYALVQALYGDATDNVPRLISRQKTLAMNVLESIMNSDDPVSESIRLYGDNFLRNIRNVVMPHYSLLKGDIDWFQFDDTYYDYSNFRLEVEYAEKQKGVVVFQ